MQLSELSQGVVHVTSTDQDEDWYVPHAPFLLLPLPDGFYVRRLVLPVFKSVYKLHYMLCAPLCLTLSSPSRRGGSSLLREEEVQCHGRVIFLCKIRPLVIFHSTVHGHLGCLQGFHYIYGLNFPAHV